MTRTLRYVVRSPEVTQSLDSPVIKVRASRKLKSGRYEQVDLELTVCGWIALANFIDTAREAARGYVDHKRQMLKGIATRMGVES